MKVFLDGNFNIKSVTDDVGDVIVRGSNSFDKLYVYVPTSAISDYTTISPLYAVKRADGRELGKYATLTNHASDGDTVDNYYGWYGFFDKRDICVSGPLEITISFLLVKNGISSEKSVCKVTVDIKDGVMVGDDVLILNNSNWTSLKASIEALVTNLANKADRTNSQQTITGDKFYGSYADIIEIVSNTVEALSAVITNLTVQENITAGNINATTINGTTIKQYNNAVLDVRDIVDSFISESTTKALSAKKGKELKYLVDTKVARADVVNNLTDTSINKPLSAKQGKILKDEIDYIYTLLDSDDTSLDELQEIVTYIKNNKSLIDGITTSKVSVSDIVDNLNSNDTNKPLSAKQGHILKGLINNLQTAINNTYTKSETDDLLDDKADKSTTYTKDDVDDKLALKQNITIPTITIAGVNYTNLEQAIGALNEYAKTIEQVIGSISGTDTSIVTKLTQLETNLSNLNTAWNTFISGTSADNIINTLTEIRDELTNLHNLITAETTRATTQENKSLYHLGAFDTYPYNNDNKKVLRQTVYKLDLSKVNWFIGGSADAWTGQYFAFEWYDVKFIDTNTSKLKISGSRYTVRGRNNINIDLSICADNDGIGVQIQLKDNSFAKTSDGLAQFKASLQGVSLQAEIVDSLKYVEDIIENENILPLDTTMAQMIRQDVVDGLNLWKYGSVNVVSSTTNTSGDFSIRIISNGTIIDTLIYTRVVGSFAKTFVKDSSITALRFFISGNVHDEYIDYDVSNLENNKTYRLSVNVAGETYNNVNVTNIMLNKGSHPYPHEPYHASKHINDEEAMLLKEETVKCRNLWNTYDIKSSLINSINDGSFEIINSVQTNIFDKPINFKTNTQYTFSYGITLNVGNGRFIVYYTDNTSETMPFGVGDAVFTSAVGKTISSIGSTYGDGGRVDYTNFMLNEGSTAQPYSENYGDIVHTKDIEPVLLWENPNPNSAYSGDVLTIPTLPNYKYLVIQFKTGDYEYTMKLPRGSSNNEFRSFLQSAGYYNSNYTIGIRMVEQQPSTQTYLYIGSGANQTTVTSDNNMCVPTKIYGTNIL